MMRHRRKGPYGGNIKLALSVLLAILLVLQHCTQHWMLLEDMASLAALQAPSSLDHLASASRTVRLPTKVKNLTNAYRNSHFVELNHCVDLLENVFQPDNNSSDVVSDNIHHGSIRNDTTWEDYTRWSEDILAQVAPPSGRDDQNNERILNEWKLQLLEIYATHHGLCDFTTYRPAHLPLSTLAASNKLRRSHQIEVSPPGHSRIAFCIVAYQDIDQLRRLVEAIHMPHHLIVIHIDDKSNVDFAKDVQRLVEGYSNAVVVQFGTIIYKTDSISKINLQLMQWLQDLDLTYDYHITLGGAVFPLWNAAMLSQHLWKSGKSVWMGELTHKGVRLPPEAQQWSVLWKKRLLVTSSSPSSGATSSSSNITMADPKRMPPQSPRIGFVVGGEETVPPWIHASMRHKSISGNQAVFSYQTVQALLNEPQVMELFAIAKYGCCCCLEERTWIAAMDILGLLGEAKWQRAMFQLWGGDSATCEGSMKNALLDAKDETKCYRTEDPASSDGMYQWGNTTWSSIVKSRHEAGVLFARKFQSDHEGSMHMLSKIRETLH